VFDEPDVQDALQGLVDALNTAEPDVIEEILRRRCMNPRLAIVGSLGTLPVFADTGRA
jgi:hypothetical protein